MRDIKFRIRNTVNGGVDYVTIEHLLTSDQSGMSSKAVNDDFQISQFTGLKDKNGVEIYEGDIVTCYPDDIRLSYMKVVEWSKDMPDLGITGSSSGPILCDGAKGHIEVTGNIHENPELLQETK